METNDRAEPPRDKSTIRWRVSGRVQGVGFRWFVLQAARNEGVTGDVKNLDDGGVEIRAEATPKQIQRLRELVRGGPAGARVDQVEELQQDGPLLLDDFNVRF